MTVGLLSFCAMHVSVFPYLEIDSKTGERTRRVYRAQWKDPETGKMRTKQHRSKPLINKFAREKEEELRRVAAFEHARTGLSDLFDDYLDTLENGLDGEPPRSAEYIDWARGQWDRNLHSRLSEVTTDDLSKKFVVSLRRDLLTDASISKGTARRVFNLFKAMMTWANSEDLIPFDPGAGLTISAKAVRADKGDKDVGGKTHSPAQMQRILDTLNKWATEKSNRRASWAKARPLIMTYMFTGMRSSEVLGLQVKHVDLSTGRIMVRQKLGRLGGIGRTKTETSRRDVPILPILRPHIEPLTEGRDGDEFLFASRSGAPKDYNNVKNKLWVPLQEAAGIENTLGLHCMRHFFGSVIVMMGRVHLACRLLGHSRPSFTQDVYAHLFEDEENAAIDALAGKSSTEYSLSIEILEAFNVLKDNGKPKENA